jgi:hypothetical protein
MHREPSLPRYDFFFFFVYRTYVLPYQITATDQIKINRTTRCKVVLLSNTPLLYCWYSTYHTTLRVGRAEL